MHNLGFNHNILKSGYSPTVALGDDIRKLTRQGIEVFPLHTGDPDFDTPEIIKASISKALFDGHNHYSDSQGLLVFRTAICKEIKRIKDLEYKAQEILVTIGAIHAYFLSLKTLLNQGDEIIVLTPSWPTHVKLAEVLGIIVHEVGGTLETGFIPDIHSIEEKVTNKTKAIVINYPSNPTGALPNKEFLQELTDLCLKKRLYIISDEVYETILDENVRMEYPSAISESAKTITISINSFSKSHSLTGHRVGYVAADAKVIKQLKKVSQFSITNAPTFIQKGLSDVIGLSQTHESCSTMVSKYQERNLLVDELLKSSDRPIAYKKPKGGFYYFIQPSFKHINVEVYCQKLLKKTSVVMVPGNVYGSSGNQFIRMTFAASNHQIKEGITRFLEFHNSNISL